MPRRYDDDDDDDDDDGRFSDRPRGGGKKRRRDDDDDDDSGIDIGRRKKRKRRGGGSALQARLAAPAICLMVVIGLHLLVACILAPVAVYGIAVGGARQMQFQGQNNMDFAANPVTSLVQHIVFFAIQAFMMFGAVQMYRGQMYGICMTTAILSVIPCCCSSCYILGIPFGIWALVVLNDPEVKSAFTS